MTTVGMVCGGDIIVVLGFRLITKQHYPQFPYPVRPIVDDPLRGDDVIQAVDYWL